MKFVGGQSCLDFVNTVGAWLPTGVIERDKLATYADLLTWGQLAGLLTLTEVRGLARHATRHPENAEAALARAARLREALYGIFQSILHRRHPSPAGLDILNAELSVAKSHERLARSAGAYILIWADQASHLDRPLWPVARNAAFVLTSPDLSRLKQCAAEKCGWLFLDISRNHGRQWCDMKDCGNRAKVRRFRQRHSL